MWCGVDEVRPYQIGKSLFSTRKGSLVKKKARLTRAMNRRRVFSIRPTGRFVRERDE